MQINGSLGSSCAAGTAKDSICSGIFIARNYGNPQAFCRFGFAVRNNPEKESTDLIQDLYQSLHRSGTGAATAIVLPFCIPLENSLKCPYIF